MKLAAAPFLACIMIVVCAGINLYPAFYDHFARDVVYGDHSQSFLGGVVYESLPDSDRNTHFASLQKALDDLLVMPDGRLQISPELVSTLNIAAHPFLTRAEDEISLERIQYLIHKSYPGAAGEEFSRLFVRFLTLEKARLAYFESGSSSASDEVLPGHEAGVKGLRQEREEFEALKQLRRTYLGDTYSRQLYSTHNVMTEYLFDRRSILEDSSLSDTEKQALMVKTQSEFRLKMKPEASM